MRQLFKVYTSTYKTLYVFAHDYNDAAKKATEYCEHERQVAASNVKFDADGSLVLSKGDTPVTAKEITLISDEVIE